MVVSSLGVSVPCSDFLAVESRPILVEEWVRFSVVAVVGLGSLDTAPFSELIGPVDKAVLEWEVDSNGAFEFMPLMFDASNEGKAGKDGCCVDTVPGDVTITRNSEEISMVVVVGSDPGTGVAAVDGMVVVMIRVVKADSALSSSLEVVRVELWLEEYVEAKAESPPGLETSKVLVVVNV